MPGKVAAGRRDLAADDWAMDDTYPHQRCGEQSAESRRWRRKLPPWHRQDRYLIRIDPLNFFQAIGALRMTYGLPSTLNPTSAPGEVAAGRRDSAADDRAGGHARLAHHHSGEGIPPPGIRLPFYSQAWT